MKKLLLIFALVLLAVAGFSQKAWKYYEKGNKRLQRQDYQGAIDYYTKAIKIDPNFAEAYCNRGRAKFGINYYFDQFNDCNKAVQLKPDFAEAWLYRGIAKIKLYDNGESNYLTSGKIQPPVEYSSYKVDTLDNGSISIHAAFSVKVDYSEAILDFDKVIEFNPDCAEAYYYRGLAKIKSKDNDDGCLDFKKAEGLGYKNASMERRKNCQ
jgi:tetratricopeptide (TPR) repeat protein